MPLEKTLITVTEISPRKELVCAADPDPENAVSAPLSNKAWSPPGSNKFGRSTLNESDFALVADWDLEAVKSSLRATVKISPT